MPKAIIDLLEIIQIQQDQRKALAGGLPEVPVLLQGIVERAPIVGAGQRIANCALV